MSKAIEVARARADVNEENKKKKNVKGVSVQIELCRLQ